MGWDLVYSMGYFQMRTTDTTASLWLASELCTNVVSPVNSFNSLTGSFLSGSLSSSYSTINKRFNISISFGSVSIPLSTSFPKLFG